jgi:L-amino acid N-acyltransferase YncA
MEIRSPSSGDLEVVLDFFARIPESERTFFKEEVLDRATVQRWVSGERGYRAVALEAGRIIGYVAVVPLLGWSDHVGELRLVVDPERRRRGVGRALARWALLEALDRGLSKLSVEVVADEDGAVAMFGALGFAAEGLLHDQVRDHGGVLRDVVVLAHPVADRWSAMESAGIVDAVREPGSPSA